MHTTQWFKVLVGYWLAHQTFTLETVRNAFGGDLVRRGHIQETSFIY